MDNEHLTNEEKEELAKENIALIYYIINKMNLSYRREELFEIGLTGLARGLKHYDKSKNIKTSTFFASCIQNEIKQYLISENALKRQAEVVSLNAVIGDEETELQELIGYDPNYDKKMIIEEVLNKIDKRLSLFPQKQRDIFYYLHGLKGYPKLRAIDIKDRLKVSTEYIRVIKQKITRALIFYLRDYKE